MKLFSCLLLISLLTACSTTKKSTGRDDASLYRTDHFTIYYTNYDKDHLAAISDTLETSYDRITKDLMVKKMDKVTVHFYSNSAELKEAVKNQVPDLPDWASGLATSATEIHMISPFLGPVHNMSNLVHEFAHCVTLALNPRFANNPRWLWESIAIFEAGQFFHPSRASYLKEGKAPGIAELNNINDTRIYELGYLFVQFISEKWGRNKIRELIMNNGDLKTSLGMDDDSFIQEWFKFIHIRYLS